MDTSAILRLDSSVAAGVDLIEKACNQWRSRLVDFSRRNQLLFYSSRKTGPLEIETIPPALWKRLLDGKPVRVSDLSAAPDAAARVWTAHKKRIENYEERGLTTLYLACGLASWRAEDGGRAPAAPVLMLPLRSEVRARKLKDIELTLDGDPHLNGVMAVYLERQYHTQIDDEAILTSSHDELPTIEEIYGAIKAATLRVPDFQIQSRFILGNFSFQKLAMVRDLADPELLAKSPIVAALAGNRAARDSFRSAGSGIDLRALDERPPSQDIEILDADSSQSLVVASVVKGRSGVIQGPPGCGKSQTIANLIAALLERGKRVLFVAEKRAALEVVMKRLAGAGLDTLVLDLAGGELKKRAVAQKLSTAIENARSIPPVNFEQLDQNLAARRQELITYERALHEHRSAVGRTLFECEGEILALRRKNYDASTRWMGSDLNRLPVTVADDGVVLLNELEHDKRLVIGDFDSLWRRVKLEDPDDLSRALAVVRRGVTVSEHLLLLLDEFRGELRLRSLSSLGEVTRLSQMLLNLGELLGRFKESLLDEDLARLHQNLAPANRSWLAQMWAWWTRPDYRTSILRLRGLARIPTGSKDIWRAVQLAQNIWESWQNLAAPNSAPRLPRGTERLTLALENFQKWLVDASLVLPDPPADALHQLSAQLTSLERDASVAARMVVVQQSRKKLSQMGVEAFLTELRRKPRTDHWGEHFRLAWLSSWVDDFYLKSPSLAQFRGRSHDQRVQAFRSIDVQRLQANGNRIRAAHGTQVFEVMNQFRDEADLVKRESQKKTRNLSLRALVDRAPQVMTTLFPCWMASPLAVSQSIPAQVGLFDAVVFDEASQVLPEDAVASLLRGKTVVVAGDRHQLPPTSFFAEGNDADSEDDEDSQTAGFESLLDQLSTFLDSWSLDWHYRSRDERLIAFSNQEIYSGRLITFPSVGIRSAIQHELVTQTTLGAAGESNSAEVERVVELVRRHAYEQPDLSLGVITLGIKHQQRVEAALELAIDKDPRLAAFWDRKGDEGPFVKNLERVQGDERDAIILSLGYAKNAEGRLPLRFGPLLQEGGYRRLNVAITRARQKMTLVSSFSHHDLDPEKIKGRRGLELLRNYVEYSSRGGAGSWAGVATGFPVNAFEADIQAALESQGLSCVPQLGVSSYRIDIAVRHPRQPGRFVLAVECDGASYHAAPTARDRDRLRQQQLEGLGWHFCRIWSTDWFLRREVELQRVLDAYRRAVDDADAPRPSKVIDKPEAPAAPVAERGPAPFMLKDAPIDDYSAQALETLAQWVRSDGRRRTDDEVVDEMLRYLEFKRRGKKIVAALNQAARKSRNP